MPAGGALLDEIMTGFFGPILDIEIANKGGAAALEATFPVAKSVEELAENLDDRWLFQMIKRVSQAGFMWSMVEAKWDGFEATFEGFVPRGLAMYADDELDELMADVGIMRNGAKIKAAIHDARFMVDLADEHGAVGGLFAEWPVSDFIGLLALLKECGSRLGGDTGQSILRFMGKPYPAFHEETRLYLLQGRGAGLDRQGVIDKPAPSKWAFAALQEAFNQWSRETGRDLSQLSRILAASV